MMGTRNLSDIRAPPESHHQPLPSLEDVLCAATSSKGLFPQKREFLFLS